MGAEKFKFGDKVSVIEGPIRRELQKKYQHLNLSKALFVRQEDQWVCKLVFENSVGFLNCLIGQIEKTDF